MRKTRPSTVGPEQVPPPAIPGHPLPQPSDLRSPGPAFDEEVVARLPLAAAAVTALVWLPFERPCHPLVEKGADRRMLGEKLVTPTSQRLSGPAQRFSTKAWARGWPVPPLWPDMGGDPLGCGPCASLRGRTSEVREAGLRQRLPGMLCWCPKAASLAYCRRPHCP